MQITLRHVQDILDLVQRLYPGWTDVRQPRFVRDEIDYKREAVAKAGELVGRDEMRRLLDEGRAAEVRERLRKVGHATNLLYLGTPSSGDLALLHTPDLDADALGEAVFDLLHGSGTSPQRLQRFADWAAKRNLPNKWTFPTYYLFLLHPETDLLVKPTVVRWWFNQLGLHGRYSSQPSGGLYSEILDLAGQLREHLSDAGAQDMVEVQSVLFVACQSEAERRDLLPSEQKQRELEELFPEFVSQYLQTPSGQKHLALYPASRRDLSRNFESIVAAQDSGEEVTDRVLLQLLPYGESAANRQQQAWVSVAPAILGDLRGWFEGAKWRKPGDWEEVAQAILDFLRRCVEEPAELEAACQDFSRSRWSTGLQSGMLSPALNALRPENFLLVNSKSRQVFNYLAGTQLGPKLTDYATLNRLGFDLVDHLADVLESAPVEAAHPGDLLDMYAHWLIAVRNFPLGQRYWRLDAGGDDEDWRAWLKEGLAALAGPGIGDLSTVSRHELQTIQTEASAGEDPIEQAWRFSLLREGDKIVASQGTERLLGIGTVVGSYYFAEDSSRPHRIPVEWGDDQPREISRPEWTTALTELDRDEFRDIATFPADQALPPGAHRSYPLTDLTGVLGLPPETLRSWKRAVERKKQAIFYGPPGTGKTFVALELGAHLMDGSDGVLETVQFHPGYSYEDFIQGIRPEAREDGSLAYPLRRGRFVEFCERARGAKGTSVLVIDEINRADLSRVFGELMYLLEYRERSIPLAAGGEPFSIPEQVRILGTMNTADRSIALVDHALRRRFAFLSLRPDYELLARAHETTGFDAAPLVALLRDLNAQIGDPHFEVGITYFLRSDIADHLEDVWRQEIEPYLEELFFDQPTQVEAFRWPGVARKLRP